jgi:hypothetical protein
MNLLVQRNKPTGTQWGAAAFYSAAAVANFAVAPDGTTTAFKLTDSDSSNALSLGQAVVLGIAADTVTRYAAVWVKKTSGATTFPLIDMRYGADPLFPTKYGGAILNTNTGVATARPSWVPDGGLGCLSWDANYWLFWVAVANNTSTGLTIMLAPAASTDGTTVSISATGSAVFWNPILAEGTAPPSVLPTDVRWDQDFMGDECRLMDTNGLTLQSLRMQQWGRCTLGRDPTAGGIWQWEIAVPSGAFDHDLRPGVGMANVTQAQVNSVPGYSSANAWSYGFGSAGIENDYSYHTTTTSFNWSGGSHGGQAHTFGLVWDAAAKTLDLYIDGVHKYQATGVGANGVLMYPIFGSGSADPTIAVNRDTGTANFVGPFTYPVVGATPYGEIVAPPEPLPRKATLIQSRAVSGAHALAQVNASTVAIAAYNSLQLATFDDETGIAALGTALALDYQLGDLAKVGSVLMSVGDDGLLHKFSTAPAETGSVAVKARYPWIAVAGSFAIVHAGGGQVAVYNTSLTKLAQHSTGLGDVVYATADSAGNVYAFDSRGRGALLIVNLSTGALEFSSKFTAANAVGVRCAYVDEDAEELVIGCSVQSRVIVMNTATMGVTSSEMNPGRSWSGSWSATLSGAPSSRPGTPKSSPTASCPLRPRSPSPMMKSSSPRPR